MPSFPRSCTCGALASLTDAGFSVVRTSERQAYEDLLSSIRLYVNWRYVTRQLTTPQKELFADAVDARGRRVAAEEGPEWGEPATAERWWRDG